jgi:hypothetical protein
MHRTVRGLGLLAVLLAATLVGCAENKAATEKCKDSTSSDRCKTCCNSAGASGYKWISGQCGCLGGN